MKTKSVKFTGIQVLDEGYVRINFTSGISHDIDVAAAINTDYLTLGDMLEDIELTVIMSEATLPKAECKKLAKTLADYCLGLNLLEQSDVDDDMECVNNPYVATWTASGTYCCCRFSSKSKALNWARGCAHGNRQWRGTADFSVYKGNQTIYKATIWHNGKTSYYVNNGVEL